MRTTERFVESVAKFIEDARAEFPNTDVTADYVEEVAGVFTENGRNYYLEGNGWVNHAVISVAQGEELSFFYKSYVDPITREDVFAAIDEAVVELVSVEEFDAFRERYGALVVEEDGQWGVENETPAPDAHLICELDPDGDVKYDALYVDDGLIVVAGQPSIEHAINFAAGNFVNGSERNAELRHESWLKLLKAREIPVPDHVYEREFVEKIREAYETLHVKCMFEDAELDLAEVAAWAEKALEGGHVFSGYSEMWDLAHYPGDPMREAHAASKDMAAHEVEQPEKDKGSR